MELPLFGIPVTGDLYEDPLQGHEYIFMDNSSARTGQFALGGGVLRESVRAYSKARTEGTSSGKVSRSSS